jgi:glutamyl-tRNA synthetase
LKVEKAPEINKNINFHPSNKDLGSRIIKTNDTFYVPKADMDILKIGSVFRLKDLFNVKIIKKNKEIIGEYYGEELIPDSAKIQWTTDEYIKTEIFVPKSLFIKDEFNKNSLEKIKGYAEQAASKLITNDIIQFERFGFVKIEKSSDIIICNFTHK